MEDKNIITLNVKIMLDIDGQIKHKEMLKLLTPLVEFLQKEGFSYFISVAKEDATGEGGTGTNYAGGSIKELAALQADLIRRNPEIEKLFSRALSDGVL